MIDLPDLTTAPAVEPPLHPRHVHFLGICGYAVSGAAILAKELGCLVTGSDEFTYPPVSDIVTSAGIDWENHYSASNLERHGLPDLVVVANGVRPGNPEWEAALVRGIPLISEIEFFSDLTRGRLRVSVCGTHGKTTTACLLAHLLERSGMDPGFRLGSTSLDFGATARLGTGPFVFEGDEYSTAPWDPRPKFLHTRPLAACVTRVELDHPDIYPTLDAYRAPFEELVRSMPPDGLVCLCADDDECRRLRPAAACPSVTYGERPDATWRIRDSVTEGSQQRFVLEVPRRGGLEVRMSMPGRHNALNATAAVILADFLGAPVEVSAAACADFRGAGRRFQEAGEVGGVTVVDDYAHHPTEVATTIAAARARYPGRRIVAVHTPHTYSRTLTLLGDYASSFAGAGAVVLGPIEEARARGSPVTVTSDDVAERVRAGTGMEAVVTGSAEEAIERICLLARPGDVILVLSLGGFDKIAHRLVAALLAASRGNGAAGAPPPTAGA